MKHAMCVVRACELVEMSKSHAQCVKVENPGRVTNSIWLKLMVAQYIFHLFKLISKQFEHWNKWSN